MRTTAIVLAAGKGKRMQSDVPKQYLLLHNKPVLYYSLKAFEDSSVDEIILVTAEDERDYCRKNIVERFHFTKVSQIVSGGKERYHSVYQALQACKSCEYVLIQDGARPFLTQELLKRMLKEVMRYGACVAAVPVKDTVKIADADGFVDSTPNRKLLYNVQTPQAFSYELIKGAYEQLIRNEDRLLTEGIQITDDAMVVETLTDTRVKLVEGAYENIKITTPQDLEVAKNMFDI